MTLREWCHCTYNVLLGGCDAIIYRPNDPPKLYKVGFIPDDIATKPVEAIIIKEMEPRTLFIHKIEVRIND